MCIRDRPYAALGATLGLGGDAVIERLRRLVAHGLIGGLGPCLLYTSDAADERSSVDLGGRRIIKKKNDTSIRSEAHTNQTETDDDRYRL